MLPLATIQQIRIQFKGRALFQESGKKGKDVEKVTFLGKVKPNTRFR